MASPLIHVFGHGAARVDGDGLDGCRSAFRERHAVHLPGLLSPPILRAVQDELAVAPFVPAGGGFYSEERLDRCPLWSHLLFLANDPQIFALVEHLTGCDPIGSFIGRVYRRSADGHFDDWHADTVEDRQIGMSINLGPHSFQGGALRLRERATQRVLFEWANVVPGDAVFFRVSEDLEHMVTAVEGDMPRTAFAGWFRRTPDFRETMLKPLDLDAGLARERRPALPRRLRAPDTVAFHALGDDLLVHGLANDSFVRLDLGGRRIWELVVTRHDVHAVIMELSTEYDAIPGELERDTHRLLGELFALGLVEAAS
jgi:hypothetical protein